jgi:anti-anti-sigma factor
MRDVNFPVELIEGIPVVAGPEEIDITNADGLGAALDQAASTWHRTLVVDLTRTRFCDSAGIHALVDAHKQVQPEGGQVLVAVSGAAVPRIFEITGIDRVLPCFPSVAAALEYALAAKTPGPPASQRPGPPTSQPSMLR